MLFRRYRGELFDFNSDVACRQLLMINVITLHSGGRKLLVASASSTKGELPSARKCSK